MAQDTLPIANRYKCVAPRHEEHPFLGDAVLRTPGVVLSHTDRLPDLQLPGMGAAPMPVLCRSHRLPGGEALLGVYVQHLGKYLGLSQGGRKVLHYLLTHLRTEDHTVLLNVTPVTGQVGIGKSTYEKAVNILLFRKAIAKSTIPSLYFVNPLIVPCKDRFTVLTQYIAG
ncbi:MAG: hypothetical protein AAFQ78_02730 [Bacteroidota bacterium]